MSRATDPLLPLPIYPGTKPRFHAMVKPTGAICNLDCAYCYYLHKEELLGSNSKFRISDEVLEAHVRQYIESQRGDEVVFSWQGGEPTLLGVGFFEKVVGVRTCSLLDCAYCYYLHKEELLGSNSKFRISDEVLEAHVRQYIIADAEF